MAKKVLFGFQVSGGKKEEKATIKHISGCEPKYNYEKPYKIKSFDELGFAKDDKELVNLTEKMNVDNILLSNRFLFDLSVIGIPSTMVKWVLPANHPNNVIEVQIYDFVDENGVPVLAKLNAYDGRKFTAEIEHLDPAGATVYIEKYNGCYLDSEIVRDSLRYASSEPSTIILRIYYDGVSYEAGR